MLALVSVVTTFTAAPTATATEPAAPTDSASVSMSSLLVAVTATPRKPALEPAVATRCWVSDGSVMSLEPSCVKSVPPPPICALPTSMLFLSAWPLASGCTLGALEDAAA